MKIDAFIEWDWNGSQEEASIDTSEKCSGISADVYDAISFALFGKTLFRDVVDPEKGPPFIFLTITCKGKNVCVARKPQYMRETAFGSRYLTEELFSLKTDEEDYPSLSADRYYELLKDHIDMTFDDFSAYCRLQNA